MHGHARRHTNTDLKVQLASVRWLIFSLKHDQITSGSVQPDLLCPQRSFTHESTNKETMTTASLSAYCQVAYVFFSHVVQFSYATKLLESAMHMNTGACCSIMIIALNETNFCPHSEQNESNTCIQYKKEKEYFYINATQRWFAPFSLQRTADAPHLDENTLPPFVAKVLLPQLCSFLSVMWKSIN